MGDERTSHMVAEKNPHELPLHYPSTYIEWIRGFTLHVLTGFIAVAAHYALMWVLLSLGTPTLASSGVGFVAGAVTRYLLSYYAVFAPTGSVQSTVAKYLTVLGVQMTMNLILLKLFMLTGLSVWIAQIITTILLTFANYIAYRLWVFK